MPQILQGKAVLLRPATLGFSPEELQRRFTWSSDDELQYWSGSLPSARTLEEFKRLLPERDWPSSGLRHSYGILALGSLIGMVSCYAIDWRLRTGELGVYIGERSFWNQGLGTDAVVTLLRHLFEDHRFQRIGLNTYVNNARAIRSYEKAGFRRLEVRQRFRPSLGYCRELRMLVDSRAYFLRKEQGLPPNSYSKQEVGAGRAS